MSSLSQAFRRTQTLEAQVGRLNSQLRSLKHAKGSEAGLTLSEIPAWEVVRYDPGAALAGPDWDPLFDDEGTTNRIQHFVHTRAGEIAHANSDSCATRMRIRFTGQGESQILMKLGMSGTGSVQIKNNGNTATYSAGAFVPINILPPPLTNELVIMADGTAGAFQFSLDGLLFDGVHRKWVSY